MAPHAIQVEPPAVAPAVPAGNTPDAKPGLAPALAPIPATVETRKAVAPMASAPARIMPRPARATAMVLAAATPDITSATHEPLPATTPRAEGGAEVQFAAIGSEEAAHSFWQSLVHRYPDVLGQRAPIVIRFDHKGAVLWRVRTEEATLADAQALCAHMRAIGQDCFVPKS
jgi:hypothetical protein